MDYYVFLNKTTFERYYLPKHLHRSFASAMNYLYMSNTTKATDTIVYEGVRYVPKV